jgi:hypothetical protein
VSGSSAVEREYAPGFDVMGIVAFTSTRGAGSFSLSSADPVGEVVPRWLALAEELARPTMRLACAHQVHGDGVIEHEAGWSGWLRCPEGDGHFSRVPGTAMAVTLADCVPIFIGHPSGAAAILHSGWKGTAAGVVRRGIDLFTRSGLRAEEIVIHAGPAICGSCYEVGPDVYARLTGSSIARPAPVDLRLLIAEQARRAGVRQISISSWCTRCHNERFFSHRCGDVGRHVGAIVAGSHAESLVSVS